MLARIGICRRIGEAVRLFCRLAVCRRFRSSRGGTPASDMYSARGMHALYHRWRAVGCVSVAFGCGRQASKFFALANTHVSSAQDGGRSRLLRFVPTETSLALMHVFVMRLGDALFHVQVCQGAFFQQPGVGGACDPFLRICLGQSPFIRVVAICRGAFGSPHTVCCVSVGRLREARRGLAPEPAAAYRRSLGASSLRLGVKRLVFFSPARQHCEQCPARRPHRLQLLLV